MGWFIFIYLSNEKLPYDIIILKNKIKYIMDIEWWWMKFMNWKKKKIDELVHDGHKINKCSWIVERWNYNVCMIMNQNQYQG
jgi:hypothetical protein